MSMFNKKFLDELSLDESELALKFENLKKFQAKKDAIFSFKEEEFKESFLREIFVNVLGYTLKADSPHIYNLTLEKKDAVGGKRADAAVVFLKQDQQKTQTQQTQQTQQNAQKQHAQNQNTEQVVAVVELKDTKTTNLAEAEKQAFGYKVSHKNCKYVIISNFAKLRFYIDDRVEFEEFDLFEMDKIRFIEFYKILSFKSLKNDTPLVLKRRTEEANESEICIKFYKDFSFFRTILFDDLKLNNAHTAQTEPKRLLSATAKLCDRFVFVAFAQDKGLLPHNTIEGLIDSHQKNKNSFAPKAPLYDYFKRLFSAIDTGSTPQNIAKFNGGLFGEDEFLNSLHVSDEALLELKHIVKYDFASEVSVNILGHIFEQSLNDLEELEALIVGGEFDKRKSKRKKDGIFYTPEFVTRYIVQRTLGQICEEKKAEFGLDLGANLDDFVERTTKKRKILNKDGEIYKTKLYAYREFLLNLKVLDPACGSGAFLNQALEFLIREHKKVDEKRREFENESLQLYDIAPEILEKNLYGVDINADACEIAKLSLWVKTAAKGRVLTNLNNNIVCANSLLDSPFDFKFDCVIGNPPYVRQESIKEQKAMLSQKYAVYNGTADLYVYFYELGVKCLREGGLLGFICSNKFFRASYGENLREFLLANTQILSVVDFNAVKIFADATVDSAITVFKNSRCVGGFGESKFDFFAPKSAEFDLQNATYQKLHQSTLNKQCWSFANADELALKAKIESVGTPLGQWDGVEINYGIKTGLNEAFIISSEKREAILAACANFDEKERTANLIRPVLRGRDMECYDAKWAGFWVIFVTWHFPNTENPKPMAENEADFKKLYPSVYAHLCSFKNELAGRNKAETGVRYEWYCLQRYGAKYFEEFAKEKICWQRVTQKPSFVLDEGAFILDSMAFLTTSNSKFNKFLLGVLNSKIIFFYFKKIGHLYSDTAFLLSNQYVEKFPIPHITAQNQSVVDAVVALVEEILEAKWRILKYEKHMETFGLDEKIEAKERVEKLQKQICKNDEKVENLVCELYGLTDEERKVVENAL